MATYYDLTQTGAQVQTILNNSLDADYVAYDNTNSGLAATDVQAAIDEVDSALDSANTTLTSAINAKAAIAISTSVSVTSASWAQDDDVYVQAVTVTGLLATDIPFCQADCSSESDAEAWAMIIKAEPTADTLTFTAIDTPSVDLTIQVVVIR